MRQSILDRRPTYTNLKLRFILLRKENSLIDSYADTVMITSVMPYDTFDGK